MAVHSILERVTAEEEEEAEGRSPEEEEGGAHSLKDVCDFGKPEPSPFSSRRVMYENEEVKPNEKKWITFTSAMGEDVNYQIHYSAPFVIHRWSCQEMWLK